MRKLLVLLSILLIFIGCGKKKSGNFTNFGSPINETEFITAGELINQKDNLNWREVAIKGEISSVCVHSGRKIGLKINDSTEVNVFSFNDDKPFEFPKEKCIGKSAEVVGIFQIKEGFPNHSESDEMAEHDENEHHDKNEKVYIIKATGVNIYGL